MSFLFQDNSAPEKEATPQNLFGHFFDSFRSTFEKKENQEKAGLSEAREKAALRDSTNEAVDRLSPGAEARAEFVALPLDKTKERSQSFTERADLSGSVKAEAAVKEAGEVWNDESRLGSLNNEAETSILTLKKAGMTADQIREFLKTGEIEGAPFIYRKNKKSFGVAHFTNAFGAKKNSQGEPVPSLLEKLSSNFKENGWKSLFMKDFWRSSFTDMGVWFGLSQNINKINKGYKSALRLEREVQPKVDRWRHKAEALQQGGILLAAGVDFKRDFERMDHAASVSTISALLASARKSAPTLISQAVIQEQVSPSSFVRQNSGFSKLKTAFDVNPEAFKEASKKVGISAREITKTAFFASLFTSILDWYIRPERRKADSLGDEIWDVGESMIPFSWTWDGTRDEINKLPSGSARLIAYGINLGLDAATALSVIGMFFTGGASGAGVAASGAAKVAARETIELALQKEAAEFTAKQGIKGGVSSSIGGAAGKSFFKSLPEKSAQALRSIAKGSKSPAGIAGGYVALSYSLDFLVGMLDAEEKIIAYTEREVLRPEVESLSHEQRRAIALMDKGIDFDQPLLPQLVQTETEAESKPETTEKA